MKGKDCGCCFAVVVKAQLLELQVIDGQAVDISRVKSKADFINRDAEVVR
jgi:hypothetical protein